MQAKNIALSESVPSGLNKWTILMLRKIAKLLQGCESCF